MGRFYPAVKRFLDIGISATALLVLAPVFVVVALAVLWDDGPPVLFVQERIGLGGKPFKLLKFRTMTRNEGEKNLFPGEHDPSVTGVGRFLRRWSLDELPQLFNVLAGQMSIVGPRPTLAYQVARYDEFQARRLLVKPGITGMAQVSGRNALSWPRRIELDVAYAESVSLWLDIKIILRTFPALIKKDGLYGSFSQWQRDPIAKTEESSHEPVDIK